MTRIGDIKIDRTFAWFPTYTDNGLIWLQPYSLIYEFQQKKVVTRKCGILKTPDWVLVNKHLFKKK